MEPGKISERQLGFLMTTVLISTVVFLMPQIAARSVHQDAWITGLIATIWGALVVLVIVALGKRFPKHTLIEYLPLILGRPLGKILGGFYVFWFLFIGAFVLETFGMFLNTTVMPETPVAVFTVTFMALAFYAVRSGLEAWTRVNEFLLPVIILAMVLVMVLPVEQMEFRRLLPIGEHSLGMLLKDSFISASWRGEVLLAAMFIPALATFRHTTRNLLISVVVVGVILAMAEVATVAVFGGINAGLLEYPFFSLARMISLAKLFDRLEILMVLVWVLGTFIKVCAFLYCTTKAAAQVMGFPDFQFLLLPVSLLTIAVADNATKNIAHAIDFISRVWGGFGILSFELVIPAILLLVALAWKKGNVT